MVDSGLTPACILFESLCGHGPVTEKRESTSFSAFPYKRNPTSPEKWGSSLWEILHMDKVSTSSKSRVYGLNVKPATECNRQ